VDGMDDINIVQQRIQDIVVRRFAIK